jgi:pantoate--beta-alanine ligase
MKIIHSPEEMQRLALKWRGQSVLVPTMGALHPGHIRLAEEGRKLGSPMVMSIFVNPIQFNRPEDLAKYPRTLESDCAMAEQAGVDVVFAPEAEGIYPKSFQTHVEVGELTRTLEGEHRPGHFRGVTTIVMKLFQIVQPRAAMFGWKDAQQLLVIRRMTRDLGVPVEVIGVETVREPDGLAMSSRNQYLNPTERAAAPVLYRGLSAIRDLAAKGERSASELLAAGRRVIESEPLIRLEYLAMVSLESLRPLDRLEPGNTLVPLAAQLGPARLIDNIRL